MKTNYLLGFILLILISCQSEPIVFSEAVRYYVHHEKKGLTQHQTLEEVQYRFRYLPNNYRVLKEMGFQIKDTLQYQKKLSDTRGQHTVIFQIAPTKKTHSLEGIYKKKPTDLSWENVSKILHFRMQKAFELRVNNDWLPCRFYHLMPSINTADGYQFILSFEEPAAVDSKLFSNDLEFRFIDKYFSGETIEFTIPKKALNQIPQLTTKSL